MNRPLATLQQACETVLGRHHSGMIPTVGDIREIFWVAAQKEAQLTRPSQEYPANKLQTSTTYST